MQKREHWGSRMGFILAASGSAVGIGNIWKYPSIAGQNGGAAFTLVYLACILVVGLSIVIAEFVIGRNTQLSPVGAFEKLAPNTSWKWVGFLGVGSAFAILSFYGVVGGWIFKYIIMSLTGGFDTLAGSPDTAGNVFNTFITGLWAPVFYQVIFMTVCIWVIIHGVKGGIEKWSKIMMPLIIILLAVLAVRGMTLPGGSEGLAFLFNPRFEELTASGIVLALGHAFFTLSLGMGTMITYGSYLGKKENLLNSALWVIFLDTAIAMLAGVAIFTTVFALGANPAEGPGLIFVVLPSVFPQLAGGTVWGTMFFILLFMAALTSAISILEVVTAYFIDQKGWSRKKATIRFGAVITVVGAFCSFSLGGGINITGIFGISFFDFMDGLSSKYMLPIGGMFTAIFILKKWGIPNFINELKNGMDHFNVPPALIRTLLTIGAAVVAFIIFNEIYAVFAGKALIG
ncbi:MAG: sodium-dependent transporter [Candidatus Marinimicrobia bacterium]|nr:sodium-dependent transporter [Candidatus Neomarinimicrobiota bacterium]MBL7009725.1 sodium-dependent transporter [Candidatus Neomarinimicrobiota bacterium]MBL7029871.1 sodium-dependent transporter [Candidatus Neomarinimicrobiota bacterium]